MTDREALRRRIARDTRDLLGMVPELIPRLARLAALAHVIADCAKRLIEARDMGDEDLVARAEANLRKALEWWR